MSTLAAVLVLSNPSAFARTGEVVEIPLADVRTHVHLSDAQHLVIKERASGVPVMTQIYDAGPRDGPDTLLLLVELRAHATLTLELYDEAPARPPSKVFARPVPERKDDFTWENDRVAYRVYGPALEATGEIASGIDVWSKRVPGLVIDSWYRRDMEGQRTHDPALSYHVDNGQGLDSYLVGSSRGCGGTAVWDAGKLVASRNVTTSRILADGPIRIAFELRYAPWSAAGVEVEETKYVELDAGSHLNHWYSSFRFAGSREITVALGLAVHDPAEVKQLAAGSIVSVWDTPQLASAGHIATGLVLPPQATATFARAGGNALLMLSVKSGAPIHYYAGAGWSQADMPTPDAWNAYLTQYLERLRHPVQHQWGTTN